MLNADKAYTNLVVFGQLLQPFWGKKKRELIVKTLTLRVEKKSRERDEVPGPAEEWSKKKQARPTLPPAGSSNGILGLPATSAHTNKTNKAPIQPTGPSGRSLPSPAVAGLTNESFPALGGEDDVKDEVIWVQNPYKITTDSIQQLSVEQKAAYQDKVEILRIVRSAIEELGGWTLNKMSV